MNIPNGLRMGQAKNQKLKSLISNADLKRPL
jgi:hypothetical protein